MTQINVSPDTTIKQIGGDSYIAVNAYYDGTNWQRQNIAYPAWLFQFNAANNMLNESYKAFTVWTAQPGANPIGAFTAAGGWLMAESFSEFKDMTIGGNGIEIDGNGITPYGRVRHASVGGVKITDLLTTAYLDESGRDDTNAPSLSAGIYDDSFKVRRAPSGVSLTWADLMIVLANGCLLVNRTADYNSTALQVGGSVSCIALGGGLRILEGANAKLGVATLTNGTVTVSNTSVTNANSRIQINRKADGGTVGASYSYTIIDNTSFAITSKNGSGATNTADTSTVTWHILESA